MVKTCIFENCKKIPSFNYENEKQAIYCSEHKKENMIDVKHKTCIFENCKKIPSFNYENEKQAIYCSEHKKENMIDVKHKTCIFENCKKIPIFNYENEKQGIYCFQHKKENMIDVKNKTCIFENCKKIPIFNYENEKQGIYCFQHKKENMIDVKNKTCKTHLCFLRVEDKYEGYCLRCYMFVFPNKTVSRNYKTKEQSVLEFVKNNFGLDKTIIADKKIKDGCSKKRPDILIDLGFQVLIIEIDENQHNSYYFSCENKRIMELSQDIGHRPIIFIRFNPDDYKDKNNKLIKSCWCLNKSGICVVKKQKINEWNKRLEILKETIEYWLNNKTDKTIEIIQLFYDFYFGGLDN
jgi:Holliday junction resolvase